MHIDVAKEKENKNTNAVHSLTLRDAFLLTKPSIIMQVHNPHSVFDCQYFITVRYSQHSGLVAAFSARIRAAHDLENQPVKQFITALALATAVASLIFLAGSSTLKNDRLLLSELNFHNIITPLLQTSMRQNVSTKTMTRQW